MIVRIKLHRGRPLLRQSEKDRNLALALGALLMPASLMAYVLGFWRLASDMGITGQFGITGVFSHWQIWIATAVLMHGSASVLNRYGRGGDFNVRRVLMFNLFPTRETASSEEPAEEPKTGTG